MLNSDYDLWDISLVSDPATGETVMHDALCPVVRDMAAAGHEVYTLLGVKGLPDGPKRHECLQGQADQDG